MLAKQDHKLILVGSISSAHGIKGDIIIKSYTHPIENIMNLTLVDDKKNNLTLQKIRIIKKDNIICKLKECINRNQSELLIGTKIYCMRKNLPNTNVEEFYVEDLKNLDVCTADQKKVGVVLQVLNFGAGDLIEVRFLNSSSTTIYPFTKYHFPIIKRDYIVISL